MPGTPLLASALASSEFLEAPADFVVPPLSRRHDGVFRPNRQRPIHRWYPFIEGFGTDMVQDLLVDAKPGDVVFDPFGGCGTTPLTASSLGLTSYFCEVNSYLAWVANVKINRSRQIESVSELSPLRELAERVENGRPFPEPRDDDPFVAADAAREYFPNGVARHVAGVLRWIEAHLDGPVAELAMLACTTSLIPASNMIRRTDLRRRRRGDPEPLELDEVLALKLRIISSDIKASLAQPRIESRQLGDDIRSLVTSPQPFNWIVTSPPYLNGTNYCRNTKLELLALGHLESEEDLAALRANAITAGINNVSRRRPRPETIAAVETIAQELDQVAYDQRIPTLVRSYFSDMQTALCRVHELAAPNAILALDIGDSRFAGVHVPTDELLSGIAQVIGWRLIRRDLLRKRRSYDGSQLVQVLLRFQKEAH